MSKGVIKTKRKKKYKTFYIININDDIVNNFIFGKMANCNWSQKINKIEINLNEI